jgi:hypothetical protein
MPQPPPRVSQTTRDNRHVPAGKFRARLVVDVSTRAMSSSATSRFPGRRQLRANRDLRHRRLPARGDVRRSSPLIARSATSAFWPGSYVSRDVARFPGIRAKPCDKPLLRTDRAHLRRQSLPQPECGRLHEQQKSPYAGRFYGRYWARTSDPQLVELVQPFARFASVRSSRVVERNRSVTERLSERERTKLLAILATPVHGTFLASTPDEQR